jgi:hypothetical protein
VVDRQGMDEPHDGHGIAVGDQGPQLRRPALELVGKLMNCG